jgi:hypothetical protein
VVDIPSKELSMNHQRSRSPYRRITITLSVLLALGAAGLTSPAAWGAEATTSNAPGARAPVARPVATPITRANAALARATTEVRSGHPRRAITALGTLRYQLGLAHKSAMNQIGKPPADPESDEPPGPPAVLAVLALDHRVDLGIVPLFDGRTRTDVVDALRSTLAADHKRRSAILDRIIALPAEGARGDYEDGMADTLGQYPKEEKQLTTAIATYRLTPMSSTALHNALTRVRATTAKVDAAFGGGE